MKAAFVALPGCQVGQVTELLSDLSDYDWSIRTLTLGGQAVSTNCGLRLVADGNLYSTFPRDFRLLLLAGGTLTPQMTTDPGLIRFLRQYATTTGVIASIGNGTSLLAAAGLLGGLHVAIDTHCVQAFPEGFVHSIIENKDVTWDGGIITARQTAATSFTKGVFHLLRTYAS